MTAFPPVLFQWLKILRAPVLLTIPGNVIAGWILAGGEHWNAAAVSFALSAVLLHLFGPLTGRDGGIPERRLPLLRTAAFATACLPALLFRKYAALMPLFGIFLMMDLYRNHGEAAARSGIVLRCGAAGLIPLLEVLLGAAVFVDGETFRSPSAFCFLFAAALCLYQAGISRAELSHPTRLAVCPGGKPMFAGALLGYLTLFVRLGMEKMHGWTSWLPGVFSALAAALFLIVSWKAFRTFRRKSLPGIVKGWILALGFNVLFLQAAAVSAAGFWEGAVILVFFSFCARALYVKLYGGDTDGRLDRHPEG